MEVLASKWLQLSPISIHTSATAPMSRLSNCIMDMLQFDLACSNNSVVSRKAPESCRPNIRTLLTCAKAPESCLTLPNGFSGGFSGWSRDYAAMNAPLSIFDAVNYVSYTVRLYTCPLLIHQFQKINQVWLCLCTKLCCMIVPC